VLWDKNPKEHDLNAIADSIREYGFRDPPEFDGTVGAIIAGNGRTTALQMMFDRGEGAPEYISVQDGGGWSLPMIFGADSKSQEAAEQYAVDHNLLTLGSARISPDQVKEMFRTHDLKSLFAIGDPLPLTITEEIMESLHSEAESHDLELENFDDSLAQAFEDVQQFSTKVQLIVDLTQDQADDAALKDALKQLSRDHDLQYRIKTAR
jgi:hypothetical protein